MWHRFIFCQPSISCSWCPQGTGAGWCPEALWVHLEEETALGLVFVHPKDHRSVGSLLLSQLANPTSPVQLRQQQPVLPNPRFHLGIGSKWWAWGFLSYPSTGLGCTSILGSRLHQYFGEPTALSGFSSSGFAAAAGPSDGQRAHGAACKIQSQKDPVRTIVPFLHHTGGFPRQICPLCRAVQIIDILGFLEALKN